MDKKKSLLAVTAIALGTVAYNYFKPVRSTIPVVANFDINRYLGIWYEIARLDFKHERNLKNVTAEYKWNEKGKIDVINEGYDQNTNEHKLSKGKAKFADDETTGALKVSFFGPFYSNYNIVQLNPNYQDVLVFGDNLNYMWILSRTKELSKDRQDIYLKYAEACGFDTSKLTWTIQEA